MGQHHMNPHIVEISHREDFSAAHRLVSSALSEDENRTIFGPCFNLHGHNYGFEATVRGPLDERTGMVMNLTDLMRIMRERVFEHVDHKYLNEDVDFLQGIIPTAENLAIAFWQRIQECADQLAPSVLVRVRIIESEVNAASYAGPSSPHEIKQS